MKVILIGSAEERARMRASLDGVIDVVGEFPTLSRPKPHASRPTGFCWRRTSG